ncbi:Protein-tyrosine phosphatase-like [Phytophthora cactorum]|nr:Protein-tyrosine phosphatase-like [Phytophthora cactorum]
MTTIDADRVVPRLPRATSTGELDVPGVVESFMLMGSVKHAMDEQLLKNLQVSCLIDAENPRKRSTHSELTVDPTIEMGSIQLDDDFSYDEFKSNIMNANKLIQIARADNKTVFVFCTHGNNESAVVCIAYLMKRPASAPRKTYVEKLRTLELETHGRVTLRSDQIGPKQPSDRWRYLDDERASNMSNFSIATGERTGDLCEDEPMGKNKVHPHVSPSVGRRKSKAHRVSCVIS